MSTAPLHSLGPVAANGSGAGPRPDATSLNGSGPQYDVVHGSAGSANAAALHKSPSASHTHAPHAPVAVPLPAGAQWVDYPSLGEEEKAGLSEKK